MNKKYIWLLLICMFGVRVKTSSEPNTTKVYKEENSKVISFIHGKTYAVYDKENKTYDATYLLECGKDIGFWELDGKNTFNILRHKYEQQQSNNE